MYEPTEHQSERDEIVAAVRALMQRRDALLEERDDLAGKLLDALNERDELRRQLEEATKDELVIRTIDLPSGRGWAYVQEAQVLAISPDLDEETRRKLLAQVEPPKLTTCGTCGAPVYEGARCGLCA